MIQFYRLALRLFLPAVASRHSDEMLETVTRLSADARRGGRRQWIHYAIMARMQTAFPQANGALGLDAQPLQSALVSDVSPMLWILMGSVGCILMIACANLANLLLARAAGRGREIAIRQAMGAARLRIARQLLVESLVLSLLGGAAGVLTGTVFLNALVAWLPPGIPRLAEATVDARVLLFTFAVSACTGLLFGLAPALQLSRDTPATVLRENTRTTSGRAPLRALLVV